MASLFFFTKKKVSQKSCYGTQKFYALKCQSREAVARVCLSGGDGRRYLCIVIIRNTNP